MAVVVLTTLAGGCGGGGDGATVAPVAGTITLNGKPVTHGYVFANPERGRTAVGKIEPDGSFVLGTFDQSDGAQIGTHAVTLGPPRAGDDPAPADAVLPPLKYSSARTSGLSMTVPPEGLTDHQIRLEATAAEIDAARADQGFVE